MTKQQFTGLFLFLMLVLSTTPDLFSQTQQAEAAGNKVSDAIRKGNASELATIFGNSIDLSLPANDGTFSRTQAEMILRDFFKRNPPKSFTVNQQGDSRDGSRFIIATYVSHTNSRYRTYFLVKKTGGEYKVHLLQFEPE